MLSVLELKTRVKAKTGIENNKLLGSAHNLGNVLSKRTAIWLLADPSLVQSTYYGLNCNLPPRKYVHMLTPSTSECDLIWNRLN